MHRDQVPTRKIEVYKCAFSHRAYNWLHDFLFCCHVILMRFDLLVEFQNS